MSKYKPIQLITKHATGCAFLNGMNPGSPWCLPEQITDWSFVTRKVGRDLTGRKNPRAQHSWVVFRCGDTSCPAQLAIWWEKFVDVLTLADEQWKEAEATNEQH